MSRKKSDEWVSGSEGAKILSENSGYDISSNYVRLLAGKKRVKTRRKDGRTNEYHRGDLMSYTVVPKSKTKRAEIERNRKAASKSRLTVNEETSVPPVATPT